jgi:hypothetical protein
VTGDVSDEAAVPLCVESPLIYGAGRQVKGIFASGNPKVAQQSGIVYLSGSLHQPTPGSSQFATLPSSFRPAHNMWITVYTVSDTSGTLYIGHDGTMEAFASGACGSGNTAQCFTSLAGVSFPVNS